MSKTLYAQDTFHLSGIGIFHTGEQIGEKVPSGQIRELETKGLIGPDKPVRAKAQKGAPENKAK